MARCEQCGDWFNRKPGEHWKTKCLSCWKTDKKAEFEELIEENELLRGENDWLRLRVYQLENRPAPNHAQFSDFLRIYPLLVKLAHPDKHNGSREAHEVLVWCNRLRDDLRKR